MRLPPDAMVFLGSAIVVFGIALLFDFSLLKAAIYIGVVFLSVVFFL